MQLNQLSTIRSERGLRAAISALFFGAKGALLSAAANFEGISRTVSNLRQAGYPDRADAIQSGKRYEVLEAAVNAAATKAASLQTFADSHGIVLEVDFAPDIPRGKDMKQLQAASEASGVDIETLKNKEAAAIKRRFDQQHEAKSAAEAAFWSAEYDEAVEVKTETVLNALMRQRDYMLEWSVLDLGELTILKHDIEALDELLATESLKGDPSEGSIDDMPVHQPSAAQMNAEFQQAIASAKADDDEEPVAAKPKRNLRRVPKAA